MICFRRFLLINGSVLLLGLAAACARTGNPSQGNTPPVAANNAPAAFPMLARSSADSPNVNANNGPVQPIYANNASVITETDDAVITLTNDFAGNRIETKVFKAHPLVNKIIVITARNRQQRARLYGNRGETRDLPPDLLPKALELNADALAAALGLGKPASKTVKAPSVAAPTPARAGEPEKKGTPGTDPPQ